MCIYCIRNFSDKGLTENDDLGSVQPSPEKLLYYISLYFGASPICLKVNLRKYMMKAFLVS